MIQPSASPIRQLFSRPWGVLPQPPAPTELTIWVVMLASGPKVLGPTQPCTASYAGRITLEPLSAWRPPVLRTSHHRRRISASDSGLQRFPSQAPWLF